MARAEPAVSITSLPHDKDMINRAERDETNIYHGGVCVLSVPLNQITDFH